MRRTARKKTPLFDRYKADRPPDELLYYLGCRLVPNGTISIERTGRLEEATDVDHIFSGQNRRPDLWGNFIGCNHAAHIGKHDGTHGERNQFIVLAMMAKWQKQNVDWLPLNDREFDEWNYAELREACGHLILPTVESVRFEDGFLELGRKQLENIIRREESA